MESQITINLKETDKIKSFEIAAVVATGILKYIFMDWLNLRSAFIGAVCIFWSLYIYKRYKRNNQVLQQWGFRKKYFARTFLFITPFAILLTAAIIWYGISRNAIFLNWHIIPILILYPAWGILQQFLMLALIAGNLQSLSFNRLSTFQVVVLTSGIFALVHYPSLPLMVFTLIMEIIFLLAYFRWRNLWPLGLYHGWVASLLLFFVLGRDLWDELWKVL
jgi:uncharacterized protein